MKNEGSRMPESIPGWNKKNEKDVLKRLLE
jgi:hypothetical protein